MRLSRLAGGLAVASSLLCTGAFLLADSFGDAGSGLSNLVDQANQNSQKVAERQKQAHQFDWVRLARPSHEVRLGDSWNDQTRQRAYRWATTPSTRNKITGVILYETPIPWAPILGPMMDPFKSEDAKKIAEKCKADFPEPWDRISCVSKAVKKFFIGFKFDGTRSFCRSHAQAFDVSFAALGINKTLSQNIDAGGGSGEEHVANIVIITNDTGATLSYVIDSAWFPGKLFPLNDLAMRFHDRDGNGRTDHFALPAISEHPVNPFRPAP